MILTSEIFGDNFPLESPMVDYAERHAVGMPSDDIRALILQNQINLRREIQGHLLNGYPDNDF